MVSRTDLSEHALRPEAVSGVVSYLESKSVKRVLCELTEALLTDKPDDPASYLTQALQAGWPPRKSPAVESQPQVRQGGDQAPPSLARASAVQQSLDVAQGFLESRRTTPRDAITQLLGIAAVTTGGILEFFSVPGGHGRRDDAGCHRVASSLAPAGAGEEAAPDECVRAADAACKSGTFADRNIVAVAVETSDGLEGCLVLRALPSHEWEADIGAMALLPALKMWGLVLSERLDALYWRLKAEASIEALKHIKSSMDSAMLSGESTNSMSGYLLDAFQDGVRPVMGFDQDQSLLGEALVDGLRIYLCDASGKLRLQTQLAAPSSQGHLNAGRALAAEVAGSGKIVYAPSVYRDADRREGLPATRDATGDQAQCFVPVTLPASSFRLQSKAVMQLTSPASHEYGDYFHRLRTEILQESMLSEVLQANERFLLYQGQQRQRQAAQNVICELDNCFTINEVVERTQDLAPHVFGCAQCTLYFLDEESDELWSCPTSTLPEGIRFDVGEGIAGMLAQDMIDDDQADITPVVLNDPSKHEHWRENLGPAGPICYNLMTAPICLDVLPRRLLGIIQVINKFESDTDYCVCGKDKLFSNAARDPKVCESCGEKQTKVEGIFTRRDQDVLEALAMSLSNSIKIFQNDIMWLKSRMDSLSDGEDPVDGFRSEFYETDFRRVSHFNTSATNSGNARRTLVPHMASLQSITASKPSTLGLGAKTPKAGGSGLHVSFGLQNPSRESIRLQSTTQRKVRQGRSRADIRHWKIDYWSLTAPEEFHLLWQALELCEIFPALSVERGTLYQYFLGVKRGYRPNPYHNFKHALSTIHYSVKLLEATELIGFLPVSNAFALIIGALVHDVDHRGRNNAFELITKSELAIRYNDLSPLENHHCAKAFELSLFSKDGERNIFKDLSEEDYVAVRTGIVRAVLATDMKNHGYQCKQMQDFQFQHDDPSGQNEFLLELLLHTADISNQLMPGEIASRWQKHMSEEFTEQAEDEARLGIPVTGFMLGLLDPMNEAKSRLGFIEFVVMPLANSLFRCFPGLESPQGSVEENRLTAMSIIDGSTLPTAEKAKRRATRLLRGTLKSKASSGQGSQPVSTVVSSSPI